MQVGHDVRLSERPRLWGKFTDVNLWEEQVPPEAPSSFQIIIKNKDNTTDVQSRSFVGKYLKAFMKDFSYLSQEVLDNKYAEQNTFVLKRVLPSLFFMKSWFIRSYQVTKDI